MHFIHKFYVCSTPKTVSQFSLVYSVLLSLSLCQFVRFFDFFVISLLLNIHVNSVSSPSHLLFSGTFFHSLAVLFIHNTHSHTRYNFRLPSIVASKCACHAHLSTVKKRTQSTFLFRPTRKIYSMEHGRNYSSFWYEETFTAKCIWK